MKKIRSIVITLSTLFLLSGCASSTSTSDASTNTTSTTSSSTTSIENINVSDVILAEDNKTLIVGEAYTLNYSVLPENATNKNVRWSVSNNEIISINNGVVTALKEGEATVTITSEENNQISDSCEFIVNSPSQQEINISIINNNNKCIVSPDKQVYYENEIVKLTINPISQGYEIQDVSLLDSTDNSLDYQIVNNKYELVIPSDGIIKVNASVIGKTIKGYVRDEKQLIESVSISNGDGTYKTLTSNIENDVIYYDFVYGETVKIQFHDNGNYVPSTLSVDEQTITVTNYEVTFKAELEDFEYFFLSLNVNYIDNTPVTGEYTLDIVSSAHVSGEAYSDIECTKSINSVDQGVTVYIKAKSSSEDYDIREVKVSTVISDTGKVDSNTVVKYDETHDVYYFVAPYSYNKVIKISFDELNNLLLRDYDLEGTYYPILVSSATKTFTEFDDTTILTVDNGGEIKHLKTSNNELYHSAYVNEVRDGNLLYTKTYKSLYFGENIIFASVNEAELISPFTTYDYIFIRNTGSDDSLSNYSLYGERMTIGEQVLVVLEIHRLDKLYATVLINYTEQSIIFNPKINFIQGEHVSDTKCLYEITLQDETLVIGTNGEGGYTSRCILTGPYGYYRNGDDTLFIGGEYVATYLDIEFDYVIDGTNITLTKGARKIVINLDLEAKTFSVISDEENQITLPEFAGNKYRNTSCFGNDVAYIGMYLEFSSTEMKLSCCVAADYNLDMDHCSSQRIMRNENVTYTYDESTKTVTAIMTVGGGATASVNMIYTGKAFKVTSDSIKGTSNLYTGNTGTLSLYK